MLKKLTRMLSFRLFMLISAVMTVGFGIYAYHTIRTHTSHLMENVYVSADRACDIIKRSTYHAMLLNQKEEVQHIINTIGNEPGVDEIRIFNKQGEIIFSTIPAEIHTKVDVQAEACHLCHTETPPLASLASKNRRRIYMTEQHRGVGVTIPIDNEFACYNAACHAHAEDQRLLGVLDITMSLASVDAQLQKSRKAMLIYAVIIVLAVAIVSGLFIFFYVRKRIKKLIIGTEQIAAGNLDYRIDVTSNDEIGQLKKSFNRMTEDLQKARAEITEWSTSLEQKVEEKTKELHHAQEHLVRMEKLASLGKLSATVAHEINNPLAGTLNYTVLALRILKDKELNDERKESLIHYLDHTKNEIARCGEIVKNMLIFAKQAGGSFAEEHLHSLVASSLMLVNHHLQLKEVHLEKELLCKNDLIICDAGQIRQALVALCVNAVEALSDDGLLQIRTEGTESAVKIIIRDNGCGIPEDIMPNIFDPFFSTKKETKGVGLGLAVVYGIIERHKGRINVESKINKGTTFCIELPRRPEVSSEVDVKAQVFAD